MRTFVWGDKKEIESDNTASLKTGTIEDLKKEIIFQDFTLFYLENAMEVNEIIDIRDDEMTIQILRLT